METISDVIPVNTKILFKFVEDLAATGFAPVSKGGIVLVEHDHTKIKEDRWGKVLAIGPDVDAEVSVGEYILVEALAWTSHLSLENTVDADKFWFTDEGRVICISSEPPDVRI
jgi:co-chaperonin GroES (HSP10)